MKEVKVYNTGDIVKLVSGGPKMSVVEEDEQQFEYITFRCIWFDSDNMLHTDHFDQDILEKIETPDKYGRWTLGSELNNEDVLVWTKRVSNGNRNIDMDFDL